jgi:hypothetical protein
MGTVYRGPSYLTHAKGIADKEDGIFHIFLFFSLFFFLLFLLFVSLSLFSLSLPQKDDIRQINDPLHTIHSQINNITTSIYTHIHANHALKTARLHAYGPGLGL